MIITRVNTAPLTYNIELQYLFKNGYEAINTIYEPNGLSNSATITILLGRNDDMSNLLHINHQQIISQLDVSKPIDVTVHITLENANNPIITHQESSYEIEKPIDLENHLSQS